MDGPVYSPVYNGGVAEWPKAAVLKTVIRKGRGFESYPLRHIQSKLIEGAKLE